MKTKLDHLNLTVKSFQESVDWYSRIFDFALVEKGTDQEGYPWGILKSAENMLCIYEDPDRRSPDDGNEGEGIHRIYHFGLRIVDPEEWKKRMKREGIKPAYGGAIQYPFSTSWYIEDPSGYEIEVVHWNEDRVRFG